MGLDDGLQVNQLDEPLAHLLRGPGPNAAGTVDQVTARADREERHEEMEFDNPLGHDEADAAGGGATQSSDKRARMAKESSVDSTG